MSAPAAPDPHDPLAPRVDDPWLYRWWIFGRRRAAYRRPGRLALALLLVALVGLAVAMLLRSP